MNPIIDNLQKIKLTVNKNLTYTFKFKIDKSANFPEGENVINPKDICLKFENLNGLTISLNKILDSQNNIKAYQYIKYSIIKVINELFEFCKFSTDLTTLYIHISCISINDYEGEEDVSFEEYTDDYYTLLENVINNKFYDYIPTLKSFKENNDMEFSNFINNLFLDDNKLKELCEIFNEDFRIVSEYTNRVKNRRFFDFDKMNFIEFKNMIKTHLYLNSVFGRFI